MFQRNKPPPPVTKLYEKYPEEPRAPSREIAPVGGSNKVPRKLGKLATHPGMDASKEGVHTIDYGVYSGGHMGMRAGEEDVKVSFKVLSDQRGSNVANRSHGRAAAIAAQERELRFNKEQGVLNNIVRNQVSLETRYTGLNKEAERAAKLQRINHAPKAAGGRHGGLFNSGTSAAKGSF